jgi:uncharacterized protein
MYPMNYLRNLDLDYTHELINVIIGARRVGKSYFVKLEVERLGTSKCLYIDLEDEKFANLTVIDLGRYVDKNLNGITYIFIDEIQNVSGWEKLIRRLYETKKYIITLTGSSSKMLADDISTTLRGRASNYYLYPFSYQEVVANKIMDYKKYAATGGLVQLLKISNKQQYIADYKRQIVYKDVIERYSLRHIDLLNYLVEYLCQNAGAPLSYRNITLDLTSAGYEHSVDTVSQYIRYLKDANFIHEVEFYARALKKRLVNNKKLYPLDHAFVENGKGASFETMVLNNLLASGVKVNHYLNSYEVDFIATNDDESVVPLQVSVDVSTDDVRQREIMGILKFWNDHFYLKGDAAYVINPTLTKTEHFGTKTIKFIKFSDYFAPKSTE